MALPAGAVVPQGWLRDWCLLTRDGYTQTPNRVKAAGGGRNYQRTHWPLCCTASLNRFLPNYVAHMWMATCDQGLAATHYGPCTVSALAAWQVPVELTCRTDYPFNELSQYVENHVRSEEWNIVRLKHPPVTRWGQTFLAHGVSLAGVRFWGNNRRPVAPSLRTPVSQGRRPRDDLS